MTPRRKEAHELAQAVIEEFRQRKINDFWKDTTIGNYAQKVTAWEKIKGTII